jgi:hypothetical protein
MTTKPLAYPTNYEATMTGRDVRLLRRIKQIVNRRGAGAYNFILIVREDGAWELIPPPPEPERIG